MRAIQQLLGLAEPRPAERETQTLRLVAQRLQELPGDQARYLAGFAYVLARVAHVDLDLSDAERARIESLLVDEGGVAPDQASLIAEIVCHQAQVHGGTEDYLVTRQFGERATREQCLALVRCLYHVAAADQSISAREDARIRQIAQELRLSHPEVLALRAAFRDQLVELREPR